MYASRHRPGIEASAVKAPQPPAGAFLWGGAFLQNCQFQSWTDIPLGKRQPRTALSNPSLRPAGCNSLRPIRRVESQTQHWELKYIRVVGHQSKAMNIFYIIGVIVVVVVVASFFGVHLRRVFPGCFCQPDENRVQLSQEGNRCV